jgi:3',5'-cyclic-AMP phosphodiesterase
MMLPVEPLYFVHISDTHIGPKKSFSRHGHRPYPCAERLVEVLNNLPTTPDFVVHTGDVVTDPDPISYQYAADLFAQLRLPIYYVNGNHDRAADIHHYLPMGQKEDVTADTNVLSYTFERKGYRFLVLDGRGPDEIDPHGLLSEAQLDLVRREATADGPPLTIFIHFPVLPMNSTWMDAYMLIVNGVALHEALLPARDRLRGVFHGHVHQAMQVRRDGILYSSAASTFSQFTAWPGDPNTGFDTEHPPGFNFVHLLPEQTIVRQHIFPRPKI